MQDNSPLQKIGEIEVRGRMAYLPVELIRLIVLKEYGKIPKKSRLLKKRANVAFNNILRRHIASLKLDEISNEEV